MDLKLDIDGDLAIESGDMVIITDKVAAIRQHVQIRLQMFQGEWFLDERLGIPYFQDILGKPTNINVIKSIYVEAILETPGIIEILDFNIDFDSLVRKVTISFQARVDGTDELLEFDQPLIIGD